MNMTKAETMTKVIVSPGYGAGWSTWNSHSDELATDPELVKLVLAGKAGSTEFVERASQIVGGGRTCLLGAESLVVEEAPAGSDWWIREYDGYETLEYT